MDKMILSAYGIPKTWAGMGLPKTGKALSAFSAFLLAGKRRFYMFMLLISIDRTIFSMDKMMLYAEIMIIPAIFVMKYMDKTMLPVFGGMLSAVAGIPAAFRRMLPAFTGPPSAGEIERERRKSI
jgi:hypothetical protein